MIPRRLELEGFLSYRDKTTIDFDGVQAAAIVGDNGTGKTSLIEAIGWALFGQGRGRGPDDYVNVMSTSTKVTFDFELGERTHRVERQRELGKNPKSYLGLNVLQPQIGDPRNLVWLPIGGDHVREVQASIEALVGLTYDQWVATSYIAQGKADAFTRLGARDRKDLLAQILDLGRFDAAHQQAKASAAQLEGQASQRRIQIATLERIVAGEEDAKALLLVAQEAERRARADVAHLDYDLQAALKARSDAQRALDAAKVREQTEADLSSAKRHLVEARAAARELAALEGNVARMNDAIDDLEQQAATAKTDGLKHDVEARRLMDVQKVEAAAMVDATTRLDLLSREGAGCPTCEQPLSEPTRIQLAEAADRAIQSHGDALGLAKTQAAHEMDMAQTSDDNATRIRANIAAMRERLTQVGAVLAKTQTLAEAEAQLEELITALEARLADLPEPVDTDIQAMDRAVGAIQTELDDARERVQLAAVNRGQAERDLRYVADAKNDLGIQGKELEVATLARAECVALAEAFGPTGVPALLIERAVPAIESEANAILERLTAGRFTVAFASQKALKSGGIRETLDIVVADDVAERPLESLSGGERQCVDLAIRIGLARMVAHRAGRRVQVLVLDEAFTALDAGRRQSTVEVIHGLMGEFEQVWFVTHDREMAESFPTRILVGQDGGTSTVRIERVAA